MKLYVWNEPYDVRWGSACVFAIGETEEEARQAAQTALVAEFGMQPASDDLMPKEAQKVINGPPSYAVDAAVCYEWSE